MGAGSPSQNNSLWLGFHNETRFASNDFCGPQSPSNCQDDHNQHGFIGVDFSTTWQTTPQYTSLDASSSLTDVNVTMGSDNLNIFTHYFDPSPATEFVLENHPISLLSDYSGTADPFFNAASMGLGPSSTLLTQLVKVGRIGRHVVGMYLGTIYPRAGGTQNGSIVLGGFDSGRIDGPSHEYDQVPVPAVRASPFKLHIKQMSLITNDGTAIGLVTDDGFDGYLSTSQYPVEFPQSVTERLASAINAKPANNVENTLQANAPFKGNLTITLDDGFEVSFPPEWITNASNITPFSAATLNTDNNSTSSSDPLIFGAAFLHQLYLTIDYESSKFYLANTKVFNNYVQPVSLCPNELPVAATPVKINKFIQMGLIGAIVGCVIGGIGMTCFTIFFVRRTLQHKRAKSAISRMEGGAAPAPKKSSLRTRTKDSFGRLSGGINKKTGTSEVNSKGVKRVSFIDSETSSLKDIVVTISDKGLAPQIETQEFEMSNINPPSHGLAILHPTTPAKEVEADRLSIADTLNNSPHVGMTKVSPQVTTTQVTLPNPDRFDNPYAASPMATPLPLETPKTGNPLLAQYRGFTDFDDHDDSDIEAAQQRIQHHSHKRTPSEQMRAQLGLTLDTSVKGGQGGPVKEITWRRKGAPLQLRLSGGVAKPKTEADYVKRNPVRSLLGGGSGAVKEGKPSALRRMFPPPGER